MQETLQTFGYCVLKSRDGAEATVISAQHAREIELLITDMMMPVMRGPATICTVRILLPNVKIIAANGLGSATKKTDPPRPGVDAFLRKSFTTETLLGTVHDTPSKQNRRREFEAIRTRRSHLEFRHFRARLKPTEAAEMSMLQAVEPQNGADILSDGSSGLLPPEPRGTDSHKPPGGKPPHGLPTAGRCAAWANLKDAGIQIAH